MLRLLGSCSRTVLLASPSTRSTLLSSTRSVSNQLKNAPNRSSDSKSSPRRSPSFVAHQLDLKKLFTEGESGQLPRPSNPRRPSVLHSSSTQESSRSASIPATLDQGTAETGNHQAEEKQQRKPRQSQMNTSQGPASPKRVTSGKRPAAMNDIETDFDGSELVPSRFDGARKDAYKQEEKEFKQPKQPKKERSLAGHGNEPSAPSSSSRSDPSAQRSPTPMFSAHIKGAENIEDLLKIFDKYVVSTELALGLQKMCQMASLPNSDAIQVYSQSDSARQRMESLLISFMGKFSDPEVMTAISFVTKFYPEDNEFTDKFSLGLNGRLRRISVHQIVRVLEELKSARHTAQWIHRVYNRLLTLAEGRYFEFDNIRDILSLTYKLSHNDRLISRLDERILEISDTLVFDDWFKILINKSMLKRRDRTIIRAACYHLLKLSESSLFPLEKLKDCLLACAMLNVHDKTFLERLIRDAFEQVSSLKDPFIFQSIITSMGTLRLRHCELLDAFGQLLLEESDLFASSRNKSIQSFIRTCAAVNYCPPTLPTLVEHHLKVEEKSSEDSEPSAEIRNRIDLVWSLSILDQANMNHLATVLQQNVFQHVQTEVNNSKIASALKLLTIYSYSLQKFSKKFLKPTFNIEQLAQQLTLKNSNVQEQLAKAVTTFAPENTLSKFSVVTSNMIVIDCLMIVDKAGTPQDLSTILTASENATNGQTTFNKVRIDESCFKIALKCLDYQDKTLLTSAVAGPVALQLRLLSSLGYKCVPIHYEEFIQIQVPNDRIKYIQRKIKEAVSSTDSA